MGFRNLIHQKFGRLTVLEHVGTTKLRHALWLCACECGEEIKVPSQNLVTGNTLSCGCLRFTAFFEVWINGRKVGAKRGPGDYVCLKEIREMIEQKFPGQPFEVYKIAKSKFPEITEKIIPYVEVVAMDPDYSSPFKIAK